MDKKRKLLPATDFRPAQRRAKQRGKDTKIEQPGHKGQRTYNGVAWRNFIIANPVLDLERVFDYNFLVPLIFTTGNDYANTSIFV